MPLALIEFAPPTDAASSRRSRCAWFVAHLSLDWIASWDFFYFYFFYYFYFIFWVNIVIGIGTNGVIGFSLSRTSSTLNPSNLMSWVDMLVSVTDHKDCTAIT